MGRVADRMFDLLRRSLDHRVDVLRHVERCGGLDIPQGSQFGIQPDLFSLELLGLGDQGRVVSGIGDRVHDAMDLSLLLFDLSP